jgi:YVTN family beta-propeller protein
MTIGKKIALILLFIITLNSVLFVQSSYGQANSYKSGISGINPQAIGIDTKNNQIYIACAKSHNVLVVDGNTNVVSDAIDIQKAPNDLVVDSVSNKIYVSNSENSSIVVIDGDSLQVIKQLDVGLTPTALAINPITHKLYATSFEKLFIIDMQSFEIKSIHLSKYCSKIAINSQTNEIYVLGSANRLTVIDGTSNSIKSNITFSSYYSDFAIDSIRNRAFETKALPLGGLVIFDGKTKSVVSSLDIGEAYGLAIDESEEKVYCAIYNTVNPSLTILNASTGIELTSIPVQLKGAMPGEVAINTENKQVYIIHPGNNSLSVFDAKNDVVKGTINLEGGKPQYIVSSPYQLRNIPIFPGGQPQTICVNPKTNEIYVTDSKSDSLVVIDGITKKLKTVIDIDADLGYSAISSAVSALNVNDNLIYLATSNGIFVIDGSTAKVVDRIMPPSGEFVRPYDIAFNPSLNLLYVTTYRSYGHIWVFDTKTNQLIQNVTVNFDTSRAYATLTVDPQTNKIYLRETVGGGSGLYIKSVDSIPMGFRIGYGLNPYGGKLYDSIAIYDGSKRNLEFITRIIYPLGIANTVSPLAVDSNMHKVYVGINEPIEGAMTQILEISTTDDSGLEGISVKDSGRQFQAFAIDQDKSILYALMTDNKLAIIDLKGNNALPIFYLPERSYTSGRQWMAINPITKELYITNPGLDSISVISPSVISPGPAAYFQRNPRTVSVNQIVTLDSSVSYSLDASSIDSFNWDFGDGTVGHGSTVTHSYRTSGVFPVHLTVVDSNGLRDDISLPVTVVESLNSINSSQPTPSDSTSQPTPSDSTSQPTPSIPELPFSILAVMIILEVILVMAFKVFKKPRITISLKGGIFKLLEEKSP